MVPMSEAESLRPAAGHPPNAPSPGCRAPHAVQVLAGLEREHATGDVDALCTLNPNPKP